MLQGTTPEANVLILIVMEDTHGAYLHTLSALPNNVLILIVMEDTHGVGEIINDFLSNKFVLILIIMEDTHGV